MSVLNGIEPKEVFRYFEEISAIPRGSRDTKRISDYLVDFAKDHDLKVIQDELNNVIIFQPGTAGYEDSEPVILQGHMDMVCEKTVDSDHDFHAYDKYSARLSGTSVGRLDAPSFSLPS